MKILLILAKIIYKQKNGLFRKSLIFPILGVFLGSYIIFITLSIMNGMEYSIIDRIKSFDYSYYIYEDDIDTSIFYENNGYESIGMIEDNSFSNLIYVKSYENLEKYIIGMNEYLFINKKVKSDSDIYIGIGLANDLNLNVGDSLRISSPLNANMITKIFPSNVFNIAGIYEMNIFDYDSKYIICSNDAFVRLYGKNAGSRKFYINDTSNIDQYTLNYYNDNELLISAIQFERNIYVFFGFAVIFFSSFILMIVMMIAMLEKRTQFSIINILGLSRRKIQAIILLNNLLFSLFLSFVGYLTAVLTINLNYKYNIFSYIFDTLPFQVIPMTLNYNDVLIFLFVLILIVSLGGFTPFIFNLKNILVVKSD